jgi:aryl-alcohol dehydrogenase-like predicted oxidoreductase
MDNNISRRFFLKISAGIGISLYSSPFNILRAAEAKKDSIQFSRLLGKTNWEVKQLSLGGQASLQWTRSGIDPVQIIVKAIQSGLNYLDTSNVYGPSQLNYGKAFKQLNLIPGTSNYDEKLRKSLYIATKTMMRYAYSASGDKGPGSRSDGKNVKNAIDDIKRSLSQMFGDGKGNYPKGAYLDAVQIHKLDNYDDVDAIYEGLINPDPKAEIIGALAGLLDLRDGTNKTGLNPLEEKLINHIGITGHLSAPTHIYAIQKDELNILDTLLVAINVNDKKYLNHQFNSIPVAKAKNMGVVGMKVFADGVFYGKRPRFSFMPNDVILSVGSKDFPSELPIKYSLSVPGVDTIIVGIGNIAQLNANIQAANFEEPLTESERVEIEEKAQAVVGTKTNYFQREYIGLTPPNNVKISQVKKGEGRVYDVTWDTAYAGDAPIVAYDILLDNKVVQSTEFAPQITRDPYKATVTIDDENKHSIAVRVTDKLKRTKASNPIWV